MHPFLSEVDGGGGSPNAMSRGDSTRSEGANGSVQDFTDDEIDELRDAFGMYDEDGNGHITAEELGHVISSLGQPVSHEQVLSMIRSVDENGDNEIDFPEFLVLMSKHGHHGARKRHHDRGDDDSEAMDEEEREELKAAFEVFDTDHSGFIDMEELGRLMAGLGQDLSRNELDKMMNELDEDHDGQVSFEEFLTLMTGKLGEKDDGDAEEIPDSAIAAASAAAGGGRGSIAMRSTLKTSNHSGHNSGSIGGGSSVGGGRPRGGARVAPMPSYERQSSQPRLPPQYRRAPSKDDLKRSAGSLQNVFEDSFGTLAVDVVASRPKNTGVGTFFQEIVDAEENNLEYDFTFLREKDDKGFTGFHKLINGIPYEGENHRGWRAVIEYINVRRNMGQLVVELQEFQKKTTPMLMACCRKPPVDVIKGFVETTRTVLTQEHGRYHGMIPLHFACKFFASRDVIALLVRERPDSIVWQDKSGRTPLHCALNNFESKLPPPHVIDILLKASDDEGNVYTPVGMKNKNGCTPLHYLVFSSKSIDPFDPDQEKDRDNAFACVDAYFRKTDLDPQTLIKELMPFPYWLVGHVLNKDYVRKILNEITCSPFCANQLFTQLYAKCIIVAGFWLLSLRCLDYRRKHAINEWGGDPKYFGAEIVVLYVAVAYLLLWELARVYSLVKIRMLTSWVSDPWNFLDIACIALVLASCILSSMGKAEDEALWILFISTGFATFILLGSFLKAVNRDWAIFLNGVVDIIKSLAGFFAMMLFTIFAFTHAYQLDGRGMEECYLQETETFTRPDFCTFEGTMLKVFTMFAAGKVDEELYWYDNNRPSTRAISILFALVVSILLINTIVAVMTRSYADSERRGEAFFYLHRFNLCVAVYKIYKLRPKKCRPSAGPKLVNSKNDKLQILWDIMVVAFGDPFKAYVRDRKIKLDEQFTGPNFVKMLLLGAPKAKESNKKRRILFVILMILWVVIGAISFGRLWPPCIRRWVLCPNDEKLRRQKVGEAKSGGGSYYTGSPDEKR